MDKVLREVLVFCNHSISLFVEAGRAAAGSVARGLLLEIMPEAVCLCSVRPMWQVFYVLI